MRTRERTRLAAARRTHAGKCIELRAGTTYCRLEGAADAVPIVLIHGATVPLWELDFLVPELIRGGFRTLRFDLYGHGLSDRPRVDYKLDLFVEQTLELLDAVAFPRPVVMLGHSLGAAIAAAVASRRPDAIDRLVLVAPMLNFNATSAWARRFSRRGTGELLMRVFGVPALVRRRRARYARIGHPHLTKLFIEQASFAGFGRALLSMIRNETLGDQSARYAALAALGREVLVISGSADAVIPAEDVARVRALLGPHSHVELAGAEHNLLLTQPVEVVAAIRTWRAKLGAARPEAAGLAVG